MQTVAMKYRDLSDQEWTELLVRSIREENIDGIQFPSFPDVRIQAQFVGSSNEDALREASQFYTLVKGYASALGGVDGFDQDEAQSKGNE